MIYVFGDKISDGNQDDVFITYRVNEEGCFLCGPYASEHAARQDADDIKTYDGIHDVRLIKRSML